MGSLLSTSASVPYLAACGYEFFLQFLPLHTKPHCCLPQASVSLESVDQVHVTLPTFSVNCIVNFIQSCVHKQSTLLCSLTIAYVMFVLCTYCMYGFMYNIQNVFDDHRVINTVGSEPYVNFTLYSKKCNCSMESCGHETYSEHLDFLNISNLTEVDSKT